jgi:glycosyltransferase involved in cell wall biosynthesis
VREFHEILMEEINSTINESEPRVTVVMPTYNCDIHLSEAIESILNQTYKNFEFIIINDDLNPQTREILNNYQLADNRIQIVNNPSRLGLISSLNIGCRMAKGEFIARMDADDISNPERFELQVQYLKDHPEIGILGSWIRQIDNSGRLIRDLRLPISNKSIRWHFLFNNSLAHSSVMMRSSLIRKIDYYSNDKLFCEDYDLWVRACPITEIDNLPFFLIAYRTREKISTENLARRNVINQIRLSHIKSETNSDLSMAELERIYDKSQLGISIESDWKHARSLIDYIRYLQKEFIRNDFENSEIDNFIEEVGRVLFGFYVNFASQGYLFVALALIIQGYFAWNFSIKNMLVRINRYYGFIHRLL